MKRAQEIFEKACATKNFESALPLFEEALSLAEQDGDRRIAALSLLHMGIANADIPNQARQAKICLSRALPALESEGLIAEQGRCLYYADYVRELLGEGGDARAALSRALELAQRGGDHRLAGECCRDLGYMARGDESDVLFTQALVHFAHVGDPALIAVTLRRRAACALRDGKPDRALVFLEEGLRVIRPLQPSRLASRIEAEIRKISAEALAAQDRGRAKPQEKAESGGGPRRKVESLFYACWEGDLEQVKSILAAGNHDVNGLNRWQVDCDPRGWARAPLHVAALRGHAELAEFLLGRGADVNGLTKYGDTPLHLAVENDCTPVVELILRHKPDLTMRNGDGHTPLELACRLNRPELAKAIQKNV